MKITSVWRRNKNTKEKKRIIRKPKIAWEPLGLKNPEAEGSSLSIDEIRRQVIQVSSRGLGQGVRFRPKKVEVAETTDASKQAEPRRKRRPGATE